MHEEIPIVPFGDILDEIRFRCKGLDEYLGSFACVVDDIGIYLLLYIVLGYGYL